MRRKRCTATATATDGPVPYAERCVLATRHKGPHECGHGFRFDGDTKRLQETAYYDREREPKPRAKRVGGRLV